MEGHSKSHLKKAINHPCCNWDYAVQDMDIKGKKPIHMSTQMKNPNPRFILLLFST
jgi:hypothetical protein